MEAINYLRRLQEIYELNKISSNKLKTHYSQKFDFDFNKSFKKYNYKTIEGYEKYFKDAIVDPFLKTLPVNDRQLLKKVYVGFLPTYEPNALARRFQDNSSLIILHSELIAALSYYSELQIIFGQFLANDLKNEKEFLYNGQKHIINCFKDNNSPSIPLLPQKINKKEFYQIYIKTNAQELFTIAHEFAHIYLNHFDSCETNHLALNGVNIEFFNPNQIMEFEADIQAIRWLLNIKKGKWKGFYPFDKSMISLAIEIFMLFHLVEVNLGFNDKNSSHPPSIARLANIGLEFEPDFDKETKEFLIRMIVNASNIDSFKISVD